MDQAQNMEVYIWKEGEIKGKKDVVIFYFIPILRKTDTYNEVEINQVSPTQSGNELNTFLLQMIMFSWVLNLICYTLK